MYAPVVQQNTTMFSDVSASKYDGDTSLTALIPDLYECVRHFTRV